MFSDLTVLQAKVLALVAWADGRFDDDERRVFQDVLEVSPGDDALRADLFRMVEEAPSKDDVLGIVTSAPREVVAAALKNAFALAMSNGQLESTELATLVDLAEAAGVPRSRASEFRRMLDLYYAALELERDLFGT